MQLRCEKWQTKSGLVLQNAHTNTLMETRIICVTFLLLSATFLSPNLSALFTGTAGSVKQRTGGGWDEAMDSGGFFMSLHGSKGQGREMCANTHERTHAQRPVFRAERNWLVKAKFQLNTGCQLNGGKKRSNIEKANCSPLCPWCQALLRACCFHVNLPNLWLFNSTSDLSENLQLHKRKRVRDWK